MTVTMQRESTEYIYVGMTGSIPSVGAEATLMVPGERPTDLDWHAAVVVADDTHNLWEDAQESAVPGDYYVAVLVGDFNGNTLAPGPGDYQEFVRLEGDTERPVYVAPEAVVIE